MIVDNYIHAYEKLSKWSGLFSFVQTERIQRCESPISFGLINSVLTYKRSETKDPVEEVKEIEDAYAKQGMKLHWLTYSHEPDELVEKALLVNEFQPIEEMTGFGLALEKWSSDLHIQGFEVGAVQTETEIETYRKIALAGFGIPDNLADIFCKIFVDGPFQDKSIQHYVAYMEGEPVTTVTTFKEDGVVGIYNVATPEAHRRRGYARTALAEVLREVQKQGAQQAVIIATPMAASVYPSVGFKEELTIQLFSK
ncbi:GNAT family N-acetyltransferase [Paenibacillus glycanilyticus]|uniref:GNAT family N-acetyltransferase n=1 Tax=Paenibacillus glycanilyticus TaxID=126569 RepID=UPI002040F831|nr:GNAT family N-acetyltransferase [Paenibacillus glycanilyticus]MCM3629786.1 GNAT family N-acetyltransferase [Paenibacillus glycanilyticus]